MSHASKVPESCRAVPITLRKGSPCKAPSLRLSHTSTSLQKFCNDGGLLGALRNLQLRHGPAFRNPMSEIFRGLPRTVARYPV